ncbi:MAG: GntR family transcriptional regulator [Planctomycetota bacterium]|jgi:DNA-binding GntR family transcriptional regulator
MIVNKQEKVYVELKRKILNGELENNVRVTERELAESLEVTRVPVREALARLEKDGLIKKIPSVGYLVENYSAEEFSDAMLLRFTIECQAAQKAAGNATDEDIISLFLICERLRAAGQANNLEKCNELDRLFHAALVAASHSKILQNTYGLISIPVFRPRTTPMSEDGLQNTFEDHENILAAIKDRDPEKAFKRAYQHTPGRDIFTECFVLAQV